jgi:hypothetical protein
MRLLPRGCAERFRLSAISTDSSGAAAAIAAFQPATDRTTALSSAEIAKSI